MSSEGFLTDAATRHQVYVQRYAGGSMKKLAKFIEQAIKAAKGRVAEGLSQYGTQRYEQQIATLQRDLYFVYSEMSVQAKLDLSDLATYEVAFNAALLGKVIKASVQYSKPSAEMIAASAMADPMYLEVGKGRQKISIAGALDEYTTKRSAEIISQVRIGSALGETSQQIARRLNPLGVKQRDQAMALVNTMTNHIASTARVEAFKANDDILEGMKRIATLDGRTTIFCMSVDQTVIPLDGPRPPYHWRCRTSLIPVIKAKYAREIPGSVRPSVGSEGATQVSSKTSYPEWLAKQPAAFQRDVLGPSRYDLFSKGELKIERFIDDNGRTLNLEQLKQREPLAFERAGMN
ncbi:head morphogenesis protein [Pseudomonas syringae group genomosp. 3]|uniref:head morphogenesis protein n=1 Tax=Pseudomonas syringae group genomosp. 3 TaxID=251701 RepID=UPI0001E291F8|nr:head morphogenesis protein [Pseudomonas syringae group genomosp. 3]